MKAKLMVARDDSETPSSNPRSERVSHTWLGWWQHTLTSLLNAVSGAARGSVRACTSGAQSVRHHISSGALTDIRQPSLLWLGASAVLVGAAIGCAIAAPGIDRQSAALAGAASLMWMAIRWIIVRFAAPQLLAEDPAAARGAVSLGLLAYSVAVTPELRFAAWLVAGAVSAIALVRLGRPRGEATRAIGLAWGMQAFVVTGGWIARNALIAVIASRG